jgi:anti-sigma factor RsiW
LLSSLSERELAELSAFADGTLPPERRAEVEAWVTASPELLELVERQRRTVAATQALSSEEPPASLVATVDALGSGRIKRRSSAPRLALAGGLAVVAAVVAAIVLTGGPGGPTVADAARLASKPPTGQAPAAISSTKLSAGVQGVAFPNFARWAGWQTQGVLQGKVDGRDATVVFYRKDGRRIAYAIVAGSELRRPSGGQVTNRYGVDYQTLRLSGRLMVTWPRGGHTCVLIGDATRAELVRLASWPLTS